MDILSFLTILLVFFLQIEMIPAGKELYRKRMYRLIIDEPFEQDPIFIHSNVPRCVILEENPKQDLPWNEKLSHEAPWPPPETTHALFSQYYKKYTRLFPDQRTIELRRLIPWNQLSGNFFESRYLVILLVGIGLFVGLFLSLPMTLLFVWALGKYVSPLIFRLFALLVNKRNKDAIRSLVIQWAKLLRKRDILTAPKGHRFYGKFKLIKFLLQPGDEEEPRELKKEGDKVAEEEEELHDAFTYFEPPEITDLKDKIDKIQEMKDEQVTGKEAENVLYDIPEYRKLALRLGIPYEEDKDRENVVFGKRKIKVIKQDHFTVPKRIADQYPAGSYKNTRLRTEFGDDEVPLPPRELRLSQESDPVLQDAKRLMKERGSGSLEQFQMEPIQPSSSRKDKKKKQQNPYGAVPLDLKPYYKKNQFALLEEPSSETEEVDTEEEILEALAAARSGRLSDIFRRHFPDKPSTESPPGKIKDKDKEPKDDHRIDIPEEDNQTDDQNTTTPISSENRIKTIP